MKRRLVSLIIRAIPFSPIRLGKIKCDSAFTGKAVGKQALSYSAGGTANTTFLEGNLMIPNSKTYILTF